MDKFAFVAAITQALAWPAVVLILTFMLRKPLRELIPLLRRLKYREVEMEFSREIAELKAQSRSSLDQVPSPVRKHLEGTAEEATPSILRPLRELTSTRRDELLRMVHFSKRVAIVEAWLEVESAAVEAASAFWLQSPSNSLKNYPKLGEYLFQCKVITESQLESFNRLKDLRNRVAHAQALDLSEADASAYVELAVDLASSIRGK